jgi:hypothetical protein
MLHARIKNLIINWRLEECSTQHTRNNEIKSSGEEFKAWRAAENQSVPSSDKEQKSALGGSLGHGDCTCAHISQCAEWGRQAGRRWWSERKSDDHCTLSQTFALKCYITPISSTSDISLRALSRLQIRPRRFAGAGRQAKIILQSGTMVMCECVCCMNTRD